MGIVSSVALFSPIFFILTLRLSAYRTFPALLAYYSGVLVYNLMTEGYISTNQEIIRYWGLANNLLDTPLMLTFLIYFSTSPIFTRRIKILIAVFLVFEVLVIALLGLNTDAITIILAPGILLIFGLYIYFFIRQSKVTITHRKSAGKAMISAAMLFAYGSYGIIYVMYYLLKTPFIEDTFLLFFLVTTLSSVLVSAGIIVEEKRIRKLNELRRTRRELSDIYAGEKKTVPHRRTVMLDFDREQWN